ncbi:MAG: RHS repeat-associated core domain-containing protein [Pyrinomonadaceae bacterium]
MKSTCGLSDTEYKYNLSGALSETKYPSGRVVRNVLDNTGRLSIVQSKKNANHGFWDYAKGFQYTAAGAVSDMQLGNGKWESATFNSRLQPTKIALGTVQGGDDKLNLAYEYNTNGVADNNGNVLKQTITVNSTPGQNNGFTAVQSYAYDELNRLKSATETIGGTQSWKEAYTFDRYGNKNYDESQTTTLTRNCGTSPNLTICQQDREMENPEIDSATNRIKELQPDGDSVKDYEYDPAGNTTKDPDGRTFKYDGENKQIKVTNTAGTIGEYSFDGDGKRVKKQVPATGETTHFIYDAGGKLIAEYSTMVEPTATAKANYLTNDTLGSPRILTDRDGNVASRRDFLPFGGEIPTGNGERNSAQGYGGQDSIRQKFTGYESDAETSLDYAKARMHSYYQGRFTSPDPIIMAKERLPDPQSVDLYVYARNNPLKYVDPNGEKFKGKDGKEVTFDVRDGQIVITSANATNDIIRLVGLINNSGSSTALSQFNRLNAHKTMVNFAFGNKDRPGLYGLHQPHGTKPDGTKGPLAYNSNTHKFEGTPDIVKDDQGNEVYAEATITIYDGELLNAVKNDRTEAETQIVGTFVHEAEHDLDPNQVQMAKTGKGDLRSWHPDSLFKLQDDTIKEIREFRRIQESNNSGPKCPPGHKCN